MANYLKQCACHLNTFPIYINIIVIKNIFCILTKIQPQHLKTEKMNQESDKFRSNLLLHCLQEDSEVYKVKHPTIRIALSVIRTVNFQNNRRKDGLPKQINLVL